MGHIQYSPIEPNGKRYATPWTIEISSLLLLQNAHRIDLHTFVDASKAAYAAISYLRMKRGDDIKTI